MAAPSQKKPSHTGKFIVVLGVLFIAGLTGYGYFSQSSSLRGNSTEAAEAPTAEQAPMADAGDAIYSASSSDIVIGKAEAPITILDYSSLSCPHCAHFHLEILPGVKQKLIDTGKAKFVYRHFPLNEPALRAAQLVECSGPMKRESFLKVLFETQKTWAYSEAFKDNLKIIANQGGIDNAAFASCLADKALEDSILQTRQQAEAKLHVDGTPSFYVGPEKITDFSSADAFIAQVEAAAKKAPAAAAPADAPAAGKAD
jgi:protein-disulfide isomerase